MRSFIIVTALGCLSRSVVFASPDLPIIPSPQMVKELPGYFEFGDTLGLKHHGKIGDSSLLRQLLGEFAGFSEDPLSDNVKVIELGLASEEKVKDRITSEGLLMETVGHEGYYLIIRSKRISIIANSEAGLLYGVQSLKQLFRAYQHEMKIPACKITDYPEFAFRGVMDDISRGPLPNLDFMKAQVRRLSELKINVFSFYIEHVVRTHKHFAYAPEDGITLAELQELQDYASHYQVQLMGSFQTLGHFRNILSHPGYAHLGISDRMLNPTDTNALLFLSEVFDELVPVFAHPIFNLNGDEAYDLARGELKSLADSIGEGQIYLDWMRSLQSKVASLGKRCGMWGDMLLKHPGQIASLPNETVVFTWHYDDLEDFDEWILPFREADVDIIVCPGILNSFRLWPFWRQTHGNISRFALEGKKHDALGVLTTVWDDGGRHFFTRDWLGVAMAADYAWRPRENTFKEILRRYARLYFPGYEEEFIALIDHLEQVGDLQRTAKLDNRILKTHFFADTGAVIIDTTEYSELKKLLANAERAIRRFERSSSDSMAFDDPLTEIAYWRFTISFLDQTLRLGEALIQWSEYQKQAFHHTNDKRLPLQVLISQVEQHHSIWEKLEQDFLKLWQKENRRYWIDEALLPFRRNIKGLQEIRHQIANQLDRETPSQISLLRFRAMNESLFTYWLGAGPFAVSSSIPEHDYLRRDGGERQIIPAAIGYYFDQQGRQIGFKKLDSERPDRVLFSDFYPMPGSSVGYAYAQLRSQEEMEVTATIRCPGQFRIFLNEELVWEADEQKNWQVDYQVPIHLLEGINHLTLKVAGRVSSDWGFSFSLPVPVRHRKHRYTIR